MIYQQKNRDVIQSQLNETCLRTNVKGGIVGNFREKKELSWLFFIWCCSQQLKLIISDSQYDHISSVEQYLCNLFCLYEKCSWKLRELHLLHKTSMSFTINKKNQNAMQQISHVVGSMTGFVDKFQVYIKHIENVISNTSQHYEKATMKGKRRNMVGAEMFLK